MFLGASIHVTQQSFQFRRSKFNFGLGKQASVQATIELFDKKYSKVSQSMVTDKISYLNQSTKKFSYING